ncbi:MAG: HEAT repeat domain-containing protein [Gammaproteobacteria bacterium]|nr:HEAT repeat domain-containing protein [Gammaproteobacteria bacterium]
MSKRSFSISDQQISSFLTNGYLDIELTLDCLDHHAIYIETDRLFQTLKSGANPHNNIVPMVPKLHDVLDDANLKSALTSLLGRNYLIHPHRHCHTNFPSERSVGPAMLQPFHKDGHAHRPRPRHREPRWLILFYSPQDTPLHRGPTAVIPGSHLLSSLSARKPTRTPPSLSESQNGLITDASFHLRNVDPLIGPPRAVLCHFDLGHGAMINSSVLPRYVHKFVVMRTEEPTSDSQLGTLNTEDPVLAHIWRWLGGASRTESGSGIDIGQWKKRLQSKDPIESTRAIYQSELLTKQDYDRAVELLEEQINRQIGAYANDEVLNTADAVNGLVQIGAIERLLHMLESDCPALVATAAYGLGQLRNADGLPRLRELIDHPNSGVVRHVISAIGIISSATQSQLELTLDAFKHKYASELDWDVRLYIVQAVIRMGVVDAAIPFLCRATNDAHAYVSSFAIEQLCRFDSDIARQAVIEPLRRQRWFPDPYFAI